MLMQIVLFVDSTQRLVHLFWLCHYSKLLWKDFSHFVIDNIDKDFSLLWEKCFVWNC